MQRTSGLFDTSAEDERRASIANDFDTRSEVSADARYIVKHLWIIFVLVPAVVGVVVLVLVPWLRS